MHRLLLAAMLFFVPGTLLGTDPTTTFEWSDSYQYQWEAVGGVDYCYPARPADFAIQSMMGNYAVELRWEDTGDTFLGPFYGTGSWTNAGSTSGHEYDSGLGGAPLRIEMWIKPTSTSDWAQATAKNMTDQIIAGKPNTTWIGIVSGSTAAYYDGSGYVRIHVGFDVDGGDALGNIGKIKYRILDANNNELLGATDMSTSFKSKRIGRYLETIAYPAATYGYKSSYKVEMQVWDQGATSATATATTAAIPVEKKADFTMDKVVDGDDYNVWQDNFGTSSGATPWEGDATFDGAVNGADFNQWQGEYGTSLPETPFEYWDTRLNMLQRYSLSP